MFSYFYSFNFYKFLKSGLLLDFIVKKIIFYFFKSSVFIFTIIFSEKFIIEYCFTYFINLEYFLVKLTKKTFITNVSEWSYVSLPLFIFMTTVIICCF